MQWTASAQNALVGVRSYMQDGLEFVRLDFAQEVQQIPRGFTLQSPPRITLDLPGVENQSQQNKWTFSAGKLESAQVFVTGKKARFVLNLKENTGYVSSVDGNSVLVRLQSEKPASTAAAASAQTTMETAVATASTAPQEGLWLRTARSRTAGGGGLFGGNFGGAVGPFDHGTGAHAMCIVDRCRNQPEDAPADRDLRAVRVAHGGQHCCLMCGVLVEDVDFRAEYLVCLERGQFLAQVGFSAGQHALHRARLHAVHDASRLRGELCVQHRDGHCHSLSSHSCRLHTRQQQCGHGLARRR